MMTLYSGYLKKLQKPLWRC